MGRSTQRRKGEGTAYNELATAHNEKSTTYNEKRVCKKIAPYITTKLQYIMKKAPHENVTA